MNKPVYIFSFIILALFSFSIAALIATNTGKEEKYFTDTGTFYAGEVGCSSMINFGSLENNHKKLNILFPEITFLRPSGGLIKFRSRLSSTNKEQVKEIITEKVIPYLNKRYDFFESIEECVVYPTRPHLINFKTLEVNGNKYKILTYALVMFFALLFLLFLAAPKIKSLLNKED